MSPIMHTHAFRLLSPLESDMLFRVNTALQQGDPGSGSGQPYVTNIVHADISAVSVVQSIATAPATHISISPTNITLMCFPISQLDDSHYLHSFWKLVLVLMRMGVGVQWGMCVLFINVVWVPNRWSSCYLIKNLLSLVLWRIWLLSQPSNTLKVFLVQILATSLSLKS